MESCMHKKQILLRLIVTLLAVLIGTVTWGIPAADSQELAADPVEDSLRPDTAEKLSLSPGTLISVDLGVQRWKRVRRNQTLEGHVALPLYAAQRVALPQGTPIHLTVESVERVTDKSSAWKRVGRAIVKAFNPLDGSVAPEYRIKVKAAEISLPEGQSLPMIVQPLRAGTGLLIPPEKHLPKGAANPAPAGESANAKAREAHSRMLLRLQEGISWPAPIVPVDASQATMGSRERKGHVFLLNALSAKQNREGDRFQAVLAEPVRLGDHVFGPGSLVEGRVVRSTPPRILSRAGSLSLRVDRLISREQTVAVDGVLDAAETGTTVAPVLDDEGILRGRKPGLKDALVDIGMSYVLGKGVDDIAETPIRAVGAAMGHAAIANAARYFGMGASAIFLVTRHGRDVRLPQYAEIEIDFGRVTQATASLN